MEADVLIIGSGAAGLTAALQLAATRKVVVLAKGSISDGATAWAQGGIAAVLEPGDNFANHIEDTMVAGAGLNNRATVEFVVENAPLAIERLAKLGVPFNLEGNDWHLTREGGHSHRRIVHVDDATGWAVQQALEAAARAHPNISLVPDMVAVDLILGRHQERFSTSNTMPIAGWPAAVLAGPIFIQRPRAVRLVMVLPWRGVLGAACRIWNSCNSTRPVFTILKLKIS